MLVSCYYNIKSKHANDLYIKSLICFDQLNCKKWLFTDKHTFPNLPELKNTEVIILELSELPFYKFLDYYNESSKSDHVKGHSGLLYLIWNSKPYFVKHIIDRGVNADQLYWCDLGMLRDGLSDTYNINIGTATHDRINILHLYPFKPSDALSSPKTCPYGDVRVGGGCFGGSVKAWELYLSLWNKVHDQYMSSGEFIGQDQRLMITICLEYPYAVNLIRPKPYDIIIDNKVKPGNPWFYMLHYLSGNKPFLYHNDYEIQIKARSKDFKPTVSVIIPTYNRYNELIQSIASVKGQTYEDYEIIVVDDGSTDVEYKKLSENQDIDILIKLENCRSKIGNVIPGGRSRNYGMKVARGQYYAFLDDDDLWLKNKLQSQIEFMKADNYKISGTNGYKFGDGVITKMFFPKTYKEIPDFQGKYGQILDQTFGANFPDKITHKHMLFMNHVIASSVIIHRSVPLESGYFRNIIDADDYDYWLTLSIWMDIGYLNQPLLMYRTGNSSNYSKCPWAFNYMRYNMQRYDAAKVKVKDSSGSGDIVNILPDEIGLFQW